MSEYTEQNMMPKKFNSDSWIALTPLEQSIKSKVERIGKPLREWDVTINYGIKTGLNEAFIIDGKTKDELIKKSPKSAEVIRPILRGRDIKRYKAEFADRWLIYIPWHFPLHNDPTITGVSERAELEFQEQYPYIYNHLAQYKEQLTNRNRAETGVRYEWYALQRWGANYTDDFSKQKIIYPNMTKFLPFYYDDVGYYHNDKAFMITGSHIAYLTAFLNSSLFKYCFIDSFPELQGGTRELRKIFIDKIPVKEVDIHINNIFLLKIKEIQRLKNNGINSKEIEIEIDNMIFDLYNLSDKEKKEIGYFENT